ncbi:hypothetical protein MTO96_020601 [Rhipicephalus appendiculatus]
MDSRVRGLQRRRRRSARFTVSSRPSEQDSGHSWWRRLVHLGGGASASMLIRETGALSVGKTSWESGSSDKCDVSLCRRRLRAGRANRCPTTAVGGSGLSRCAPLPLPPLRSFTDC